MAVIRVFLLFLLIIPASLSAEVADSLEQFDISADHLRGLRHGASELIILRGHVRILHGTTEATADSGLYDRTQETVVLVRDVHVSDRGIEITGEKAEYLRNDRQVVFPRGIEARDTSAYLQADYGDYDLRREILYARGHVFFKSGERTMRADEATYDRNARFVRTQGEVYMEDEQYGAILRAGDVTYDQPKGFGLAVGEPWLEILARPGRGRMDVTADSMELYADEKRVVAIGDVNILRGDTHAEAGRALFLEDENKTVLTENPRVTEGNSSISGETVTVFSSESEITRVVVSGAARSVYQPEGGESTELTGEVVDMGFTEGEMTEMMITGGADGVFLPPGADTTKNAVRNEVHGNAISLSFKGGEVKSARVTGTVTGTHSLLGENGQTEIVNYRSDSLYYDVPAAEMDLSGGAEVDYSNMRLLSESIRYNSDTHDLYATVEPVLWEGNDKITGSSLSYNLRTRRGAIATGRTAYDGGLYTGRVIRKTGENALNVEGGTYTTCNDLDPHYTFTSPAMKVYVNDKAMARPLIMRIRGLPVLALPYFMFPIKRGRHSGILMPNVEFGFYQDNQRFVRNLGYYWAPSDYFDLALWGDLYENTRSILYLETRYRKRYLLSGEFDGSYLYEMSTGHSRWDAGGTHTEEIGEHGRLILHADFVSDATYRRDTSQNLEKALRRELESDVSYSNRWGQNSMSVAVERRQNLDTDEVTQALPTFNFLAGRVTLFAPSENEEGWHRGTYISGRASGSNTLTRTGDNERTRQQALANVSLASDFRLHERSQSLRSNTVFSTVRKGASEWCSGCEGQKLLKWAVGNQTDFVAKFLPFGWLNLDPSVTTSVTLYNDDLEGHHLPARLMYWGGFSSTASIFRTYFTRIGFLQAVRHVMTPRISYIFRPDFSEYQGRFFAFPGISSEVGKASLLSISLEHRLQAKVETGGETRKINNLLSLETSTSYDFLYKEKGKETPLSTIGSSLRFYPLSTTELDLNFSNNPKDLSFETFNLQTSFSYSGPRGLLPGIMEAHVEQPPQVPEEGVNEIGAQPPTARPWRLGVIFRYTKGFEGAKDNYWVDLESGFNLTANWRVEYGGRFDLSEHQTAYQEFSLYRDLHCWEARFVRRQSLGVWQYYFRINIKVHPEIYAERGLRALYRTY